MSRAPGYAEAAGTVRFSSVLEATLRGERLAAYDENGSIDFSSGDFESTLSIAKEGELVQRRKLGRVMYARARSRRTGRAVPWRGVRSRRAVAAKRAFSYLQIDPQAVLDVLRTTRGTPALVGHASIAGVPSTEYRTSTTLGAFLTSGQSGRTVPGEGAVPGTLDVWLDLQGRPVRVAASFSTADRLGPAVMTVTTTFADYGAPVVIVKPGHAPVAPSGSAAPNGPLGGDPVLVLERIVFGTQRVENAAARVPSSGS